MLTSFQVLVLATSLAAGSAASSAAQQSVRQWSAVRSPEYGFNVEFPATAERSEPAPGRVKWSVELDNGFTAYLFETMTITPERLQTAGSARVLDDAIAGGIAQLPGATVLHQGIIELGGNPGREVSMRVLSEGTPLRVTSRVYLVGQRLYMLVAVAKEAGLDDIERDRFLKSLALISR